MISMKTMVVWEPDTWINSSKVPSIFLQDSVFQDLGEGILENALQVEMVFFSSLLLHPLLWLTTAMVECAGDVCRVTTLHSWPTVRPVQGRATPWWDTDPTRVSFPNCASVSSKPSGRTWRADSARWCQGQNSHCSPVFCFYVTSCVLCIHLHTGVFQHVGNLQ